MHSTTSAAQESTTTERWASHAHQAYLHAEANNHPEGDVETIHDLAHDVDQIVRTAAVVSTANGGDVINDVAPVPQQKENKRTLESEPDVVARALVHIPDLKRIHAHPLANAATQGKVEGDPYASVDVHITVVEQHLQHHLLRAVVQPLLFLEQL